MKIPQIDLVHAKHLQRAINGLPRPLWRAINADALAEIGAVAEAELSAEEDLVALARALEPLSDELFVVAVDIRRVPESAALLIGDVEDLGDTSCKQ